MPVVKFVQNEVGAFTDIVIVLLSNTRGQFWDCPRLQNMRDPEIFALTANPPPTIAIITIIARAILAFFI